MPDYSAYQVDLDTPQPGGGRGESPRSAFTKVNELMTTLGTDIDTASDAASDAQIAADAAFDAASAAIPASQKGVANGVAELGENGIVRTPQLPPLAHGQCRFVYSSATECRLMPYNGNGLIINGKQYRIPSAGVPIASAAFSLAATSLVFAKDDGAGAIALEAAGIGVGHSTHGDGVEIKTGDPSRTLVGLAIVSAGTGQFSWTQTSRYVASWFNRRAVPLSIDSANTTASGTYVALSGVVDAVVWGDTGVSLDASGVVLSQATGSTGGYFRVVNANTLARVAGGWGYSLTVSGLQVAAAMPAKFTPTEGYTGYRVEGYTSVTSVPVRWAGDLTVMVMI